MFYIIPASDPPTATFGAIPDGVTAIDFRNGRAPFAGLRMDVAALEEVQRLHLRYLRWQDGCWRADLTRADLTGAFLTGVDLTRTYLTDANLTGANLTPVKRDLFDILDNAPHEVAGLLAELIAGRVDGTTYTGECSYLVGTVARLQGCDVSAVPGIPMRSERPAERWFLAIRPGHTPKNSTVAAITATWIEEWIAVHSVVA